MSDLKWKDEYSLGILAVDLQHERIFECFVTIAGGSTWDDTMRAEFTMVQLVRLLREHFALEENLMRFFGYPELERHIEEHLQFHAHVHDLAQKTIKTKESISREAIQIAQAWLRDHIVVSDRHYVDFFAGLAPKPTG